MSFGVKTPSANSLVPPSIAGAENGSMIYALRQRFSQEIKAPRDTDPNADEKKLSVNEDYFHRIHDIAFGDKGNKDIQQENAERIHLARQEEEREQDDQDFYRDFAMEEMDKIREARLEKMYNINGFEFTDEELDAAIESILDDPSAFAQEENLTEEEMDSALELVLLLEKADTHEERTQILQDWGEKAPKITEAVLEEVKAKQQENSYIVEKNSHIVEKNSHIAQVGEQSAQVKEQSTQKILDQDAQMKLKIQEMIAEKKALETQTIKSEDSQLTDPFNQISTSTLKANTASVLQDESVKDTPTAPDSLPSLG